jgi:N-acetylglucosaminyldiphosphoundecaprenol N-acetyl-beta-D-mannosaminyltransferase
VETVRLGPLELARITHAEATAWVLAQARAGVGCVVVTSNIHHLRLAEVDGDFKRAVEAAELNVADGWPLVAATRLLGRPVPERVAGVDLVRDLLAAPEPLRLAVIGGASGAAVRLAESLEGRHDCRLVDPLPRGTWETADAQDALAERLHAAEAQLTLLAIGPPRQELLADHLRAAAAGPIVCCGASVEILAGLRPRAPRALQAVGLEWAFRLALEPARLGPRYAAAAPAFARIVGRELWRRRHD